MERRKRVREDRGMNIWMDALNVIIHREGVVCERERECVCVCDSERVRERERERERECERVGERERGRE